MRHERNVAERTMQAASRQTVEKINVFWLSMTSQGGQERPEQPNRASQGAQEGQFEPARAPRSEQSSQIEPARAPRSDQGTQIEAARASQGAQSSQIEPVEAGLRGSSQLADNPVAQVISL